MVALLLSSSVDKVGGFNYIVSCFLLANEVLD